jgi:hypothetical protein
MRVCVSRCIVAEIEKEKPFNPLQRNGGRNGATVSVAQNRIKNSGIFR